MNLADFFTLPVILGIVMVVVVAIGLMTLIKIGTAKEGLHQ